MTSIKQETFFSDNIDLRENERASVFISATGMTTRYPRDASGWLRRVIHHVETTTGSFLLNESAPSLLLRGKETENQKAINLKSQCAETSFRFIILILKNICGKYFKCLYYAWQREQFMTVTMAFAFF